MKKFVFMMCVLSFAAKAAFVELKTVAEFEKFIDDSNVPVVVQFSAYWCGPCQNLIATFKKVAPEYKDSDIKIAHIDAYVNSKLKSYLQGGYPTVRTFYKGSLTSPGFVGSQTESYLKNFLNDLIKHESTEEVFADETTDFCPVY